LKMKDIAFHMLIDSSIPSGRVRQLAVAGVLFSLDSGFDIGPGRILPFLLAPPRTGIW